MDFDWDRIRIFCEVAEAGSFTRAGELLNLNQSSVSRHISTLEHELKIYVRELGDRGLATDELNRRIDQLFKEHDINTSSTPKMDVTLTRRTEKHVEDAVEAVSIPVKDKVPVPESR